MAFAKDKKFDKAHPYFKKSGAKFKFVLITNDTVYCPEKFIFDTN